MNEKRVLLVEDAPEWLALYKAHLKEENYILDTASNIDRALKLLSRNYYDAVVTDLKMIGFSDDLGGFSVLDKVKETNPSTQVVIITAYGTKDIAFRATQRGAFDIVYKPPDADRFKVTIRGAVQATAVLSQHFSRTAKTEKADPNDIAAEISNIQSSSLFGIMGNSRMMREAFEKISYAVNVDQSVFIFGEKGTGKSFVAKIVYANSARKGKPFSQLNFLDLINHWDLVIKNIKRLSGGTVFVDNILEFTKNEGKHLVDFFELAEKSNVRLISSLTTKTSEISQVRNNSGLDLTVLDKVISIPIFIPPLRLRKDGDDIPALIGNYIHNKSKDAIDNQQVVISVKAMEKLVALEYKNENINELYKMLDRVLSLVGTENEILEEYILIDNTMGNNMNIQANDKTPYVFISYAKEDSAIIDRLQKDLEKFGVKTWRDRDKLYAGLRWRAAIRKAVKDGALFIACFSKASEGRSRTYMYEELNLAVEEMRLRPKDRAWFIPVILNQCEVPDWDIGGGETLNDIQYLELFVDWEKSITSLVSIIRGVNQKA